MLIFVAAIPSIFIISQFTVLFILISFWLSISQFISVSVFSNFIKFLSVFSNFLKSLSVFLNFILLSSSNLPLLIISWLILIIFYFIPLISVFFLVLISTSQLFYSQLLVVLTVRLELSFIHLSTLSITYLLLFSIIFSSSRLLHNATFLFWYLSIIFSLFHCNYLLFFGIPHFHHRIFDSPIILHIYYDNLHIICGPILVMIELGSLGLANNIFCNT